MRATWIVPALTLLGIVLLTGCSASTSRVVSTASGAGALAPTYASGDATSHLQAADAALDRNDLSTAEKEYRDAAGLDPRSAEAQLGLGNVYVRLRLFPEAEKSYKAALALDSGMAAAQTNLGRVYYEMGQLSKAADALSASLKLDPNDAKTLYMLAVVRLQDNRLSDAEQLLVKARTADPDLPEVYYGLGVLYRLKGQKQDAINAFERFLAIGPGQDPAAVGHARQELESLRGQ